MGTVVGIWIRRAFFCIASAACYVACSSSAPPLGGETNWLDTCTKDSDCTGGTKCLCGFCTKTCATDDACGSHERACATSGSPAHQTTCGSAAPTPGICLGTCPTGGCGGQLSCSGGFCVPAPTRDGGPADGRGGSSGMDVTTSSGGQGHKDATPDQESAAPETSITDGSCSTFGPWPASPTTFDPTCTPNCDAPACGGLCPTAADRVTGMPCDTGCCASNKATLTAVPSTLSGSGGLAYSTVAVSPSGKIYYGMAGWTTPPNYLPFSYAATTDLTSSVWPEVGMPDIGATQDDAGRATALAKSPLFAFGKHQGRDVTYAAYVADRVVRGGRFGIQDGSAWTFEDLPDAPIAMTTDATGAPLVLVYGSVLRRNASAVWDSYCLPNIEFPSGAGIAVDATGAWYVAYGDSDFVVRVSRRDPNGTWSTEAVTSAPTRAFASAIAVGAGTVHVAYTLMHSDDGGAGPGGDLYYARRIGTSWVAHVVTELATLQKIPREEMRIGDIHMAIDGCGAPHIALHMLGSVTFDAYYFRFTQSGWRGARFENTCNANMLGGLGLTGSQALMSFRSCEFQATAIPLK